MIITRKKATIIALILLLLTTVAKYTNTSRLNKTSTTVSLAEIPTNIQEWTGKDDSFSGEGIYDFIGADKTLLRHYTDQDHFLVTLYIGYYPETREGKRPHAARGCYTGQGWSILADDFSHIQEKNLSMTRLLLKQGESFQRVFYWFQNSRNQTFKSEKETNQALFFNKIRLQQGDIAFIRFSAFIPEKNHEEFEKKIINLISHLKPHIDETLSKEGIE